MAKTADFVLKKVVDWLNRVQVACFLDKIVMSFDGGRMGIAGTVAAFNPVGGVGTLEQHGLVASQSQAGDNVVLDINKRFADNSALDLRVTG